ncbi:UPF0329 protein ECU05_1680/ECU11_0050-like [Osmia bicornis bicornis]|uniref:UPF0329 protein ECU05_1680/ECU11_0050-like n=1 Tax=Osmia bicornis bicornis TaxID=1437191 RepID=UPI001EAF6573|nr:UPF0329 protein ECU05_1680/ECU11_0050-like [Osmia bicornis bicornis]
MDEEEEEEKKEEMKKKEDRRNRRKRSKERSRIKGNRKENPRPSTSQIKQIQYHMTGMAVMVIDDADAAEKEKAEAGGGRRATGDGRPIIVDIY